MAYNFILDNSTILANEPIGFDATAIKISRDSLLNGLLIKYTTALTFVGDGYTYIKNIADTNGACSIIEISIVGTGSDSSFSFQGRIYVENIKFDLVKCLVQCSIEDSSLYQTVIRLLKTKIDCSTATSIGGTVLTTPETVISMKTGTTSFGTGTGAITTSNSNRGNTNAYKLFTLIQYLLDYITDSGITLQSDFLTTNYLPEERSYLLGGTVAISDVITYTYTNMWGIVVTDTVTATSTSLTTLASAIVKKMSVKYTSASPSTDLDAQAQSIQEYQGDTINHVFNVHNGAASTTIRLSYFVPFAVVFSSTGATTFTETVDQSYVYGAGDLYISSGSNLNFLVGNMIVSLEEVLMNLKKLFNIAVRFYESGGIQYCRIEPAEYFYSQTTTIATNTFNSLTKQYVTDIGISDINFSRPAKENYATGLQYLASYAVTECYSRTQDSNTEWRTGWDSMFGADYLEIDDREIMIYQSDGIIINNSWLYLTNTSSSGGSATVLFLTGLPMLHYFVAKNHGYFGAPQLIFNSRTLTIDSTIQIQVVYEFQTTISCETLDTLLNNPMSKITFTTPDGTCLQGWIKTAEYSIKSGLTNISIYSE